MELFHAKEIMRRKRPVVFCDAEGNYLDTGRIIDVQDYGKGQGELCIEHDGRRQWWPLHFIEERR